MTTRRSALLGACGLALAGTLRSRGALGASDAIPDPGFSAALNAAKGKPLNLIIDPDQAYQDVVHLFSERFPEINVQTTVMHPSDATPRILTEQRNQHFGFDAWWGMCTNMNAIAGPAGVLAQFPDYLLLPDVKAENTWVEPSMIYTSPGRFVFVHTLLLINQGCYNAGMVPGGELTLDGLLDPSLRHKICIRVPNRPHGGSIMLAQIAKEKGFAFVEKLLTTMNPIFVDNDRQNTMSVMRGDNAVGIGTAEDALQACHTANGCANIKFFPTANMQARGVSVLRNAPNAAGARIWVNWLLSKEGQEAYVKNWAKTNFSGAFSMRKDVAPDPAHRGSIPDYAHIEKYCAVSYDSGWADVKHIIDLYNKTQRSAL